MEKVLIIDDNRDLHYVLEGLLKKNKKIQVFHAYNGMEGLKKMREIKPSLTILDNQMGAMSGFDLLEELDKKGEVYTIVMLTAFGRISDAVKAIQLGALDYITKPFKNDEFNLTINKALKIGSLKKSKKISRALLKSANSKVNPMNLIGESQLFKDVLENAELVASTDIDVLITGSNGTGKEEIAKLIHYYSLRSGKPFVTVDCGAIPETLVETEFFGSVKGSYTGAIEDKVGYFEEAHTGTIFLDEIGNLPYKAQASLLRALQTRRIKRVGDTKEIAIDVRIICATNAKLLDSISENTFKPDLFHRINGFDIKLPDLKDRKEDIIPLANHFITSLNSKLNRNVQSISPDLLDILVNHNWSGNVRELQNCLRKAVLLSKGNTLETKNITLVGQANFKLIKEEDKSIKEILDRPISFEEKLVMFENMIINDAVEKNKGNKSEAAKFLHISRKKLYDRIKRFKLFNL